jgi:hypothetical protein
MKNILFFTITLFSFLTANAQITKGNWMVGGTGNFSSYENKFQNNGTEVSNKGIGISISPNIGYFFKDKFAIGSIVSIGYTNPQDFESSTSYSIGPFVRYYFLKVDNQINLFAEASYLFGESKLGNNKSASNGYGFKAGPVFYFNNSVGLEVTIDYNSTQLLPSSSGKSVANNLQIGLGFQIHLEK